MSYTYTPLADYIIDQLLGYQQVNLIKNNIRYMVDDQLPLINAQFARFTVLGSPAWTPTGSWIGGTVVYTGAEKREWDMAYYTVKIALSGAPTAANLTVNLPGSRTIDTAKLMGYDSTFKEVGLASAYDTSASAGYTGMVCYNSTTSVKVMMNAQAIHAGTVYTRLLACDNASPVTFATGDMVTLTFKLPIVEFA